MAQSSQQATDMLHLQALRSHGPKLPTGHRHVTLTGSQVSWPKAPNRPQTCYTYRLSGLMAQSSKQATDMLHLQALRSHGPKLQTGHRHAIGSQVSPAGFFEQVQTDQILWCHRPAVYSKCLWLPSIVSSIIHDSVPKSSKYSHQQRQHWLKKECTWSAAYCRCHGVGYGLVYWFQECAWCESSRQRLCLMYVIHHNL